MDLTHNEGKSVVAERFIRTIKNKIYKHKTSISKNVCIDKLDDIVNKYNNTKHRKTEMKPIEVKDNTTLTLVIMILSLMIMILSKKLVIM